MMAVQCNPLSQLPRRFNKTTARQQFTPLIQNTRLLSTPKNPAIISPNNLKLSKNRVVSAMISEEKVGESSFSTDAFKLTYLEVNSWLWEVGGVKILVDPVLVGNLDFGIPFLFEASKKYLKNFQLTDLPEIDCLLITQSLEDHCHLKTLIPLSIKLPNLKVIATPNAKSLLDPLFTNETVGKLRADIVITPVIKQLIQSSTLVSGQEDAVHLAKLLCSKYVVPMNNGDLDSKGVLASLIKSEGTIESFKGLLLKELPDVKVLEPVPGVPLDISASQNYYY
ncbi:hypothetical protein L2E82_13886 [Cichorium intybus]|uniref:Uncharacterized protein n=1 Tax=Cichorium intybus TaxID=13427 RepID=A0ACB9EZ31_CICIN|nr:hypothetical protein L2E82_13886 [Cichorium intybus]